MPNRTWIAAYKLLTGEVDQIDLVYSDLLVTAENAEEILPMAN